MSEPSAKIPTPPIENYQNSLAWVIEIVRLLRSPDGCAWDKEQTHRSLIPHLLEETYETIDAIENSEHEHFSEELGDILLQVLLHAQIASEGGYFDLNIVAKKLGEKLIRRHPHVFSTDSPTERCAASTADDVVKQWETIKRAEKNLPENESKKVFAGYAIGLPGIIQANDIQKKAARVGFDWPNTADVLDKLDEECAELREAHDAHQCASEEASLSTHAHLSEELGDCLFTLVNFARKLGLNPEVVMQTANRKFLGRFSTMEVTMQQEGHTIEKASLETMERHWQMAKNPTL